jgi:hypothetical protein
LIGTFGGTSKTASVQITTGHLAVHSVISAFRGHLVVFKERGVTDLLRWLGAPP